MSAAAAVAVRPACLDAALRCAERGWPVFPLAGKVPVVKNGLNDATTDRRTIVEWWTRRPESNLGLTTGTAAGIWVLDLDTHSAAENGLESIDVLEAEHGPLPDTMIVRTGTGGLHLYWSMPEGVEIRNRQKVRPGVDVRGQGGYVVVPPSIHPETGVAYVVPAEFRRPIAAAPEWLVKLVAPPKTAARLPPPAPVGVRLRPGEYDREADRRMRSDPGTRERAGIALGGKVCGNGPQRSIKGVVCPACGRPSVWWPIYPQHPGGTARCAHLNSCRWWGHIGDLLRGGKP